MGDALQGQQSQTPQIVPGFEFLPDLIKLLTAQGLQQYSGSFGANASPGEQDFLAQLQGLNIPGILGQGFQQLQNISTGSLSSAAEPGLARLLNVGSANLNEQAALGGVLSSTGAQQNQADFTANTISQLQQALAPLQLSAATTLASPSTAQIGAQAFSTERNIQDKRIERELQAFLAGQSLIPGLLTGAGAAAGGTPVFQPTTGSSKFEGLLGSAAPFAQRWQEQRKSSGGKSGGGSTGGGGIPLGGKSRDEEHTGPGDPQSPDFIGPPDPNFVPTDSGGKAGGK